MTCYEFLSFKTKFIGSLLLKPPFEGNILNNTCVSNDNRKSYCCVTDFCRVCCRHNFYSIQNSIPNIVAPPSFSYYIQCIVILHTFCFHCSFPSIVFVGGKDNKECIIQLLFLKSVIQKENVIGRVF